VLGVAALPAPQHDEQKLGTDTSCSPRHMTQVNSIYIMLATTERHRERDRETLPRV
jgi:hypothetical protein